MWRCRLPSRSWFQQFRIKSRSGIAGSPTVLCINHELSDKEINNAIYDNIKNNHIFTNGLKQEVEDFILKTVKHRGNELEETPMQLTVYVILCWFQVYSVVVRRLCNVRSDPLDLPSAPTLCGRVRGRERFKFLVIKQISHGDVMYSIRNIVVTSQ